MKVAVKKILLFLGIFAFLFVVVNWQYFWQNLRYSFVKNPGTTALSASSTAEPDMLIIDSLGIKAPIIYVSEKGEPVYQEALKNGVVHFPGTAEVGQLGNVYIFGHSSDYFWSQGKYKTVFALLPRIKKGAEIWVSDAKGVQFKYIVTDSFVASANDVKFLDQQGNTKKLLTLQTSWPIGTALKRWIVRAEIK